jgi:hypothetical protein
MTKACIVAVVGLLATGCKNQIDSAKVEANMREGLAAKGVTAKVTCPGGREAKAGDVFDCEAVDAQNNRYKVTVTQRDAKGTVEWKLDGSVVDTAIVIADAKAQLPTAQIECPSKGMIVKGSGSFACPLTDGDRKTSLVVTVDNGNVAWEVAP